MRLFFGLCVAVGLAAPAAASLSPEDLSAAARAGWAVGQLPGFERGAPIAAPPGRPVLDLSEEFLARQARLDAAFDERTLARLRGFKVLFVRGFLTDVYDRLGFGAFGDQLAWLQGLGVDCELVAFNTQAGLRENASAVAAAAAASPKPALVISHSKGSLDVLEALIAYPEKTRRIKGWVSIQGPFWGSPIVDWILSGPRLEPVAAWLLELLGGSRESLASLSVAERRGYMDARSGAIAAALRGRAVLCFGSWKDADPRSRADTLLKFSRDWMAGLGLANDGLVPVESAFLEGAVRVRVAGVDHAAPVMRTLLPLDRPRFTRALLEILLAGFPD